MTETALSWALRDALVNIASKTGLRIEARADVARRLEGVVIPTEEGGFRPPPGFLSVEDWVKNYLQKEAPHFFVPAEAPVAKVSRLNAAGKRRSASELLALANGEPAPKL